MSRRKIATATILVLSVVISAFYLGTLYPQYGILDEYTIRKGLAPIASQSIIASPKETAAEPSQERMVIYNAYISLETKEIQEVLARARALAERYGGYVAGSSQKEGKAQITIRVPKDKFQSAISEIESYGKVLDERTTSEDVTERYIDLKARLENLQKQEQRLREILGMARTVDEVLKVERELERVRGQIESLQGQVNYLERNVAMAVILVNLTEPQPPFTPPGMNWNEVLEAALKGLYLVLRGMIILVVSLLPIVAAIAAPAYWVYSRRRSRAAPKTP